MTSDDLLVLMMLRLFTVSEILIMVELETEARLERTRGASCRGGGETQRTVWNSTEVMRITHSN